VHQGKNLEGGEDLAGESVREHRPEMSREENTM